MLSLKKKEWIIKQKRAGKLTDSQIAMSQGISRRYVQKIWSDHNNNRGLVEKPLGRPEEPLSSEIKQRIVKLRNKGHGIRRIEGLLKIEGIKVSHNKIHKLLTQLGRVTPEPKKGRRKKYIRWERKHSNSLWQTDFCWIEKLQCWLCAWLDDHSRFVPIAAYFTEATTENVLNLFEKATKRFGYPRQTLSDRGSQFYPNLGKTCRFIEHMKSKGVDHIFASIKKPTTCGKLERFWGTHQKERWNFTSLRKFLNYYNYKRPHMSLDYLTPYQVYFRDMKV
jgi:putative transposase